MDEAPPHVTQTEIDTYEPHGVVCLRDRFDARWLARLAEGGERALAAPGR